MLKGGTTIYMYLTHGNHSFAGYLIHVNAVHSIWANPTSASKTKGKAVIAYFTVTILAEVDLVLIKPFLLYYAHYVVLLRIVFFKQNFHL